MNKQIATYLYLIVFGAIGLSCNPPEGQKNTERKSEQQKYYERIPDAPIDLYCYLNNGLNLKTKVEICGNLSTRQVDNLSMDMLISIKGDRIDTIETEIFYFDSMDILKRDTFNYSGLSEFLNSFDKDQISSLKNEDNKDVALRIQLERVCNGQVQFYQP